MCVQVFKRIRERNTQIVTLHVRGLQTAYWRYNWERWNVAFSLMRTLKKQRFIEDFDVRDAQMAPADAKLLLYCLYLGPKDTLKRLDVVNLISEKSPLVRRAGLAIYLSLFIGLREIHMNFVWLTPRVLTRLSLKCLDLQLLALEIFSPNFKSIVTTGHWAEVTDRLPNLKVYLTLRDSAAADNNVDQLRASLLPHLPSDVIRNMNIINS